MLESHVNSLKVNIDDGKFVLIKGKILTYAPPVKISIDSRTSRVSR